LSIRDIASFLLETALIEARPSVSRLRRVLALSPAVTS